MIDINHPEATDDQDESQRLTSRQQFLQTWQWPIAFGPFVFVIVIAQLPVSNALPNWSIFPVIAVLVVLALAFTGYVLYLKYMK